MARKKLRFLMFDFPGDHEVDVALPTECELIKALLTNRGLGSRLKLMKFSSGESLKKLQNYKYDPKFIHISGHGGPYSLGLIGGSIRWKNLCDDVLTRLLNPLEEEKTRVLFLSCCHSRDGVDIIKNEMPEYFTGAYFYNNEIVPFATSITISSMFYRKKILKNPHAAICKGINTFFNKKLLSYVSIP
jgi:hypothetical protein